MIRFYFVLCAALLSSVNCAPGSYQYVRFIRNGPKTTPTRRSPLLETSRSFHQSGIDNLFSATPVWEDEILNPVTNSLSFEQHRGHITPDFSNGLEYPDPLLLTGLAAKRAAAYLYNKPLFFGDVKHVELMYKHQRVREANGLAGNKLGSLRPPFPFYRFKKEMNYFG